MVVNNATYQQAKYSPKCYTSPDTNKDSLKRSKFKDVSKYSLILSTLSGVNIYDRRWSKINRCRYGETKIVKIAVCPQKEVY